MLRISGVVFLKAPLKIYPPWSQTSLSTTRHCPREGTKGVGILYSDIVLCYGTVYRTETVTTTSIIDSYFSGKQASL